MPKALPIEIDARDAGPLGMPPERFLRDYWQKRPLLIRNAFPGFVSPITPEDLAGLSCEDGTLGRLIQHDRKRDRWKVRQGPFPEELFPGLGKRDWTLLVQDVDKWDADVAALLEHFDFLPHWRLDDIMVSFAATGGSVGAHIDQYDVFLLQGHGHRRWLIDARPNPPVDFRPDVELKLLQRFDASHEWILGPGDMLYLPPGVPHHGIAEDPCLTLSVGMRAPSSAELLSDWADSQLENADDAIRYQDPDLELPADATEIDAASLDRVTEALNKLRNDDPEWFGDWFGRFITLYRASNEAAPSGQIPARIEVEWVLEQGGELLRHPWTRAAWRRAKRGARLYVGGQDYALPVRDAQRLARASAVDGRLYRQLGEAGRELLLDLLAQGHYQLAGAAAMDDRP